MLGAKRSLVYFLLCITALAEDTWRGALATPTEIKQQGGFTCNALKYGLRPYYSIYHHVGGEDGMQFRNDDGMISTSTDKYVALQHVPLRRTRRNAYLYKIAPTRNFIDATATMRQLVREGEAPERLERLYDLFRDEDELSAMHSIPWRQVKSWTRIDESNNLKETVRNPDYDRRFDSATDGGPNERFIGIAVGPVLPGHPESRDPDPSTLRSAATRYFQRIRFRAPDNGMGSWA